MRAHLHRLPDGGPPQRWLHVTPSGRSIIATTATPMHSTWQVYPVEGTLLPVDATAYPVAIVINNIAWIHREEKEDTL